MKRKGIVFFSFKGRPAATVHAYKPHQLHAIFSLPLSIFKLRYLNKGQLRTLFAKIEHCSFKTQRAPRFEKDFMIDLDPFSICHEVPDGFCSLRCLFYSVMFFFRILG